MHGARYKIHDTRYTIQESYEKLDGYAKQRWSTRGRVEIRAGKKACTNKGRGGDWMNDAGVDAGVDAGDDDDDDDDDNANASLLSLLSSVSLRNSDRLHFQHRPNTVQPV